MWRTTFSAFPFLRKVINMDNFWQCVVSTNTSHRDRCSVIQLATFTLREMPNQQTSSQFKCRFVPQSLTKQKQFHVWARAFWFSPVGIGFAWVRICRTVLVHSCSFFWCMPWGSCNDCFLAMQSGRNLLCNSKFWPKCEKIEKTFSINPKEKPRTCFKKILDCNNCSCFQDTIMFPGHISVSRIHHQIEAIKQQWRPKLVHVAWTAMLLFEGKSSRNAWCPCSVVQGPRMQFSHHSESALWENFFCLQPSEVVSSARLSLCFQNKGQDMLDHCPTVHNSEVPRSQRFSAGEHKTTFWFSRFFLHVSAARLGSHSNCIIPTIFSWSCAN